MTRAPFGIVSAPSDLFYSDQYALLNSHLTSATERADSLVVVCGADGIGKSTLLNQYLAGLDEDRYCAAFDETCAKDWQFHRLLLEQLGFGEIEGSIQELQRITREFLVQRAKHGESVLLLVDNVQSVQPAVLEQLRWISDIKDDDARAISLALAGNLSLRRIMDSQAMRALDFRYRKDFHIRAFTKSETDAYVRHHLNRAGAADAAEFSDEACALVYRFTGGIPRLINVLCNDVLAECCAQGTRVVSEQRVRSVVHAREMLPHVVAIKGNGRRRTDAAGSKGGPSAAPPPQDLELDELVVQLARLSHQLETSDQEKRRMSAQAARHDRELGELRAQLADSERLRMFADKAGQSLADEMATLGVKLDAANKVVERLTCRQEDYESRIDELTRALADSKVALAERHRAIRNLAADLEEWKKARPDEVIVELRSQLAGQATELNSLLTTAAENAAEMAGLKAALSDSRKMPQLGEEAEPKRSTGRRGKRRKARRAGTRSRDAQAQPEAGNREQPEQPDSTAKPQPVPEPAAGPAPDETTIRHSALRKTAAAAGLELAIEVYLDRKRVKVVDLGAGPLRMMVGRAQDCELRLESKFVSRHHAFLVCVDGHAAIEDLHSANGILVNLNRVSYSELRPGDTVAIGNFELRLTRR